MIPESYGPTEFLSTAVKLRTQSTCPNLDQRVFFLEFDALRKMAIEVVDGFANRPGVKHTGTRLAAFLKEYACTSRFIFGSSGFVGSVGLQPRILD